MKPSDEMRADLIARMRHVTAGGFGPNNDLMKEAADALALLPSPGGSGSSSEACKAQSHARLAATLDQGWQKIETAPKDGADILLCKVDGFLTAHPSPYIGWFHGMTKEW